MSDSNAQPNRHTPGPYFHPPCSGIVTTRDGGMVADCRMSHDRSVAYADADRIAACLNACDGINPEAVPELVEACGDLIEYVGLDTDEPVELPRWRFDAINAALTKAKGGAT